MGRENIEIPIGFQAFDFSSYDEAEKRKLVERYNDKLALISDTHLTLGDEQFKLARLRFDWGDWGCYYAEISGVNDVSGERLRRLRYHDLNVLIVATHSIIGIGEMDKL
jgi:hypothetical protein